MVLGTTWASVSQTSIDAKVFALLENPPSIYTLNSHGQGFTKTGQEPNGIKLGKAKRGGYRKFHIPSDLVVDQWVSNVESSSPRDVLLLHDLWTTFRHLLWSQKPQPYQWLGIVP